MVYILVHRKTPGNTSVNNEPVTYIAPEVECFTFFNNSLPSSPRMSSLISTAVNRKLKQ